MRVSQIPDDCSLLLCDYYCLLHTPRVVTCLLIQFMTCPETLTLFFSNPGPDRGRRDSGAGRAHRKRRPRRKSRARQSQRLVPPKQDDRPVRGVGCDGATCLGRLFEVAVGRGAVDGYVFPVYQIKTTDHSPSLTATSHSTEALHTSNVLTTGNSYRYR